MVKMVLSYCWTATSSKKSIHYSWEEREARCSGTPAWGAYLTFLPNRKTYLSHWAGLSSPCSNASPLSLSPFHVKSPEFALGLCCVCLESGCSWDQARSGRTLINTLSGLLLPFALFCVPGPQLPQANTGMMWEFKIRWRDLELRTHAAKQAFCRLVTPPVPTKPTIPIDTWSLPTTTLSFSAPGSVSFCSFPPGNAILPQILLNSSM